MTYIQCIELRGRGCYHLKRKYCNLGSVCPQMKKMEERLRSCDTQRELAALRRKLELVEEEKRECGDKCSKSEVEVKDLRFTGNILRLCLGR